MFIGDKFECFELKNSVHSGKLCNFLENSQNSHIEEAKCEKLGMIVGI